MTLFEQQKWDKAQFFFSMHVTGGSRWSTELFVKDWDRKACFEGALAMSTDLPSHAGSSCKSGNVLFKLGKSTETETRLLVAAKVGKRHVRSQVLRSGTLPGNDSFSERELGSAEKHCLVASNGRWRILGKSDDSWHESITLLDAIH